MANKPTSPDPTSNKPRERGRFAKESELAPADRTLFETVEGRERSRKDVQPGDPEGEDAPLMDISAKPRSEETSARQGQSDGLAPETEEGLDPTEEAVREQAEDRPVGRDGSR